MSAENGGVAFKFRYMKNNTGTSVFAKEGEACGDALILDGMELPCTAIGDTACRDSRIILLFSDLEAVPETIKKEMDGGVLILHISKGSPDEIKRHVDRMCSKTHLEKRMEELAAEGKAEAFRAELCPECGAAIDLCELTETRYIHCPFCETVFGKEGAVVTSGTQYRICDECGLFDRIKGYTIFYFYFLLYIWGYSYRRQHLCANCTKGVFWKMLLCNMWFLVGLPHTIAMKIKSLTGHDPELKRLGRANAFAIAGKMDQARPLFDELLLTYPAHPGLLYNQGLGCLNAEDPEQAVQCFSKALESCANYGPAIRILLQFQALVAAEEEDLATDASS